MRSLRLPFVGLLALLGAAPGWAASARDAAVAFVHDLPAYAPEETVAGRIVLWGHGSPKHDFMGSLMGIWQTGFARVQPRVTFENRMYGTASAIGALSVDAGNLAILGEEINDDAAREFRRAKGYAPTGISIATGSLDVSYFDYAHMIFVHRDNPLTHLSLAQLDAIFGAEHRRGDRNLRRWSELGVGGELGRREIQPYCWPVDEDFSLFFRERVLQGSHRWNAAVKEFETRPRPDGTVLEHGQQILEALAKDPAGIAVSTVRFASPEVKLLALSERDGETPVRPTEATLIAQTYPLTRIIPAYFDLPPGGRMEPAVREFLRFILSREGQEAIVRGSAYLPLNAGAIARSQAVLR